MDLSHPTVMGVLNVTPDSFSDGGKHFSTDDAIRRADEIVTQGAGIIDFGAESTRPGAGPVAEEEQIRRVEPVIRAVRDRHPTIPISIDTTDARVALRALEAGVGIVNDISALRFDSGMASVVVQANASVILMHMLGEPKTMQKNVRPDSYGDVVEEILSFLRERLDFAVRAGIAKDRIAVDPGIGFGKTVEHNLTILNNLHRFLDLQVPVVFGASRKGFIGHVLDRPDPRDRLAGSLACASLAAFAGVQIIRAHDVRDTVDAVRVAAAIRNTKERIGDG